MDLGRHPGARCHLLVPRTWKAGFLSRSGGISVLEGNAGAVGSRGHTVMDLRLASLWFADRSMRGWCAARHMCAVIDA